MDAAKMLRKISAIRQTLQAMEEELILQSAPKVSKPRNSLRQHFEDNELTGTWRKPAAFKKQKTGA